MMKWLLGCAFAHNKIMSPNNESSKLLVLVSNEFILMDHCILFHSDSSSSYVELGMG